MSSWWCCACTSELGGDISFLGEAASTSAEDAPVLLGRVSNTTPSPEGDALCSKSRLYLDAGSVPSSADTSCSDLAESTSTDECAQSATEKRDTPTSGETAVEEDKNASHSPDVRSLLEGCELAAVQALERELGEAGIEAVRDILVAGEALESCLLRFLRCQNMRARQAAKALKADLTWRAAKKPTDLVELTPGAICGCADELLEKYMPTWHQGYDRQGRPVVISHYGKFRFGPLLEAGVTVEKMLQLHIRNSERTARLCGKQSSKLGCDISTALIIVDVEGLDPSNLRHLCAFECMRGFSKIDQEHYVDRLGQLLFVNAPSCLHYFWKSSSWMLPQKTRSLVSFYGGRDTWEPALLELIDASELPLEYGGSGPALMQTERPLQ